MTACATRRLLTIVAQRIGNSERLIIDIAEATTRTSSIEFSVQCRFIFSEIFMTMHSDDGGGTGHAVKLDGNSICADKNKKQIFSALPSIGAKVVQGQAAGKEFCDSHVLPAILIDRKNWFSTKWSAD